MAIIKFKDENGNFIDIPSIKGETGITSTIINSIEVVSALPEVEKKGVLYLVKENSEPVLEYITNPTMEMGDISRSGVLSDSTSYCRTADYVYVYGKSSITIANGTGSNTRVLAYDENKTFMTDWVKNGSTSYSYKHVNDGSNMDIPSGAYYIKARFSSSEVKPLTITYND